MNVIQPPKRKPSILQAHRSAKTAHARSALRHKRHSDAADAAHLKTPSCSAANAIALPSALCVRGVRERSCEDRGAILASASAPDGEQHELAARRQAQHQAAHARQLLRRIGGPRRVLHARCDGASERAECSLRCAANARGGCGTRAPARARTTTCSAGAAGCAAAASAAASAAALVRSLSMALRGALATPAAPAKLRRARVRWLKARPPWRASRGNRGAGKRALPR